ncbi:MAG TPA: dienelactone hydrolase family protein [Thermodesulfobacteriota bacterium]|nr:dienelactone hydrolase family protein [Thermodesulfobacteriota bacterium]
MMRIFGLMVMLIFVSLTSQAYSKVVGETVEYKADGTVLKGYIAYDDSIKGQRPGVLIVHEWWGLNDYAKKRADMLAGLGYTALAVDMYGEGKSTKHAEDAQKFMTEVMSNMDVAQKRFKAAMDLLKAQPTVNPEDTASIGYCFGGGVVLYMASIGTDLDGAVSFHGSVGAASKPEPGSVKAKILVFTGGADPLVPLEQVEVFKKQMDEANADYEVVVYPGLKHSFTNPDADEYGKSNNLPLEYNKEADEKSWEQMQEFLKTVFQPANN